MPKGPIAGFTRPLAESELTFNTALFVGNEFGMELESDSIRSTHEEEMEKMIDSMVSRHLEPNVKLSPAGNIVGLTVALGIEELRNTDLDNIEDSMDDIVAEFEAIKSFAVPTPFNGFGEPTDDILYTVKGI